MIPKLGKTRGLIFFWCANSTASRQERPWWKPTRLRSNIIATSNNASFHAIRVVAGCEGHNTTTSGSCWTMLTGSPNPVRSENEWMNQSVWESEKVRASFTTTTTTTTTKLLPTLDVQYARCVLMGDDRWFFLSNSFSGWIASDVGSG